MTFLPESFRRFVLDLARGHDDLIVSAADLQAAAELMVGPAVTAADFDLDDLDTAPGMTWHPSYINTLADEFGREIAFRLEDVLDEWTDRLPHEETR